MDEETLRLILDVARMQGMDPTDSQLNNQIINDLIVGAETETL